MKKIIVAVIFVLIAVTDTFAQSDTVIFILLVAVLRVAAAQWQPPFFRFSNRNRRPSISCLGHRCNYLLC
jgi:hypothetical protein